MTWTARSPGRNRGLPRNLREDASSVTVGESEASVKVQRTFYRDCVERA